LVDDEMVEEEDDDAGGGNAGDAPGTFLSPIESERGMRGFIMASKPLAAAFIPASQLEELPEDDEEEEEEEDDEGDE
jgi:hypothetical protein